MAKRIRQVIAALTARITPEDREFVKRHLNSREEELFWAMGLPDQQHALNVTRTAIKLSAGMPEIDSGILVRSCLLHDVGRVRGDLSTVDKIIAVLAHRFFSCRAAQWGCRGKGGALKNIRHAFYVYYNHADLGAQKLAAIGTSPKIIEIVRKHHGVPAENDPPELRILRKADNLH